MPREASNVSILLSQVSLLKVTNSAYLHFSPPVFGASASSRPPHLTPYPLLPPLPYLLPLLSPTSSPSSPLPPPPPSSPMCITQSPLHSYSIWAEAGVTGPCTLGSPRPTTTPPTLVRERPGRPVLAGRADGRLCVGGWRGTLWVKVGV